MGQYCVGSGELRRFGGVVVDFIFDSAVASHPNSWLRESRDDHLIISDF